MPGVRKQRVKGVPGHVAEEQLFARIMEKDSEAGGQVGSTVCSDDDTVVRDMIVCFDRNGIARRAITVYIR